MNPVSIIGMGLSFRDLTADHLEVIKKADILVGGRRHLDCFKDHPGERKIIGREMSRIIEYIKKRMKEKSIAVLASGDPLFYGIGSLLIESLGRENIAVYPNISVVAAAFSRIKEPRQDVEVISMHGRNHQHLLLRASAARKIIAVLTDPDNHPARLARLLVQKRITDFDICVFERLGAPEERIRWYRPDQAAETDFAEPNLMVLKRRSLQSEKNEPLFLGIPDEQYERCHDVITKQEVRAITISKLRLLPDHVMWDLGAGSGSVSIEASLSAAKGKIIAVENKPDRIRQLERNRNRFQVKNLNIIQATLPSGLEDLPAPDRIFIGGGGKDLGQIIKAAGKYLAKNGIMVVNTVIIQNLQIALDALKRIGLQTDIVQVQISRGFDMPWGERLKAENPVWIISGNKADS